MIKTWLCCDYVFIIKRRLYKVKGVSLNFSGYMCSSGPAGLFYLCLQWCLLPLEVRDDDLDFHYEWGKTSLHETTHEG